MLALGHEIQILNYACVQVLFLCEGDRVWAMDIVSSPGHVLCKHEIMRLLDLLLDPGHGLLEIIQLKYVMFGFGNLFIAPDCQAHGIFGAYLFGFLANWLGQICRKVDSTGKGWV